MMQNFSAIILEISGRLFGMGFYSVSAEFLCWRQLSGQFIGKDWLFGKPLKEMKEVGLSPYS